MVRSRSDNSWTRGSTLSDRPVEWTGACEELMISLPRGPSSGRSRAPQFPPIGTARAELVVTAKLRFGRESGFSPPGCGVGFQNFASILQDVSESRSGQPRTQNVSVSCQLFSPPFPQRRQYQQQRRVVEHKGLLYRFLRCFDDLLSSQAVPRSTRTACR